MPPIAPSPSLRHASRTQTPRDFNVSAHLRAQARAQGDALAIAVARSKRNFSELSYQALEDASDGMAAALLAAGVARGTRTIVMVPPSPEFFALTFAMFKIGAVPVFLDPAMGVRALKMCMSSVEPQAFIGVAKAQWARVIMGWDPKSLKQRLLVGPGVGPGDRLRPQAMSAKSKRPSIAQVDKDELAAILFTSGSTGVPKGVEYTHGMFSAQVDAIRDGFGIRPGERELSTFPLFALFGPALGMASIVPDMDTSRPGKSDPQSLMDAVQRYQCTSSFMSPALVKLLATSARREEPRLSSLRRVISAGAPSDPKVLEALAERLDPEVEIYTPYGMTEAMPITKIEHREILNQPAQHPGGVCVGPALPEVQIDIIDIDERSLTEFAALDAPALTVEDYSQLVGQARRLGVGEVGEIVVTAPVVSARYWQRPIATQNAKIGNPAPGVPHRSGDLGYLDEEGRLWVCGRKAHRVQSHDRRYLTLPCEAVINQVPGVARTALVGVGLRGAQRPVLCIELAPEIERGDRAKVVQAAKAAAQADPRTQGIQDILVHGAFPVDPRHNAKINREALAAWAAKKIR